MAERGRPPPRTFDRTRAAQILADARALGSDRKAAEQWGVTERTIRNYRIRMKGGDAELSQKFLKLEKEELEGWATERTLALNAAMKRARELLPTETDLRKIGDFVESVGGVDVAKAVLGEGSRSRSSGAEPAEDAGEPGEGEGGSESFPH
jgi:hypothetical protein